MPDNIGYTPGTGAVVAADEIGGVLHQRIKINSGEDGTSTDISDRYPLQTQEISSATSLLNRILSVLLSPIGFDRSLGRQRVTAVVESGTVTTVTTVTTITGLSNIDSRNGAMLINQTNLSAWADCHRARIT